MPFPDSHREYRREVTDGGKSTVGVARTPGMCLQGSQKQITWDEDLVAGARVLEAWLTGPGWIPLCPHVVCVTQTVAVLTHGVLDTCPLRCWGPAQHPTNPQNCL